MDVNRTNDETVKRVNENDKLHGYYFSFFEDYDITTPQFTLRGRFIPCRIVDVIDGDSIVVVLSLFNHFYKYHVRINGVDTCETRSHNPENRTLALRARCRVLGLITGNEYNDITIPKTTIKDILNNTVYIAYLDCKDFDKYGRLLADVYTTYDRTTSIAQVLLDNHLAYPYTGETKLTEQDQLQLLT